MIRIENGFLRSKFARHIFLLFIFSAIIPVAVIAFLSLSHISSQLSQQGYVQSRLVSKAIGMELYRRLTKAQEELAAAGNSLVKQYSNGAKPSLEVAQGDAPSMAALALIFNSGEVYNLRGEIAQPLVITDEQKQQLALEKTVIQTQNVRENNEDILMVRSFDINGAASGLLVGKVERDFIWDVNDLLPTSNDLLVLSPSGMILHSSRPSQRSMLPTLMPLLSASISGHFEWVSDGETNLASFWSVFTQDLFSSPNLVIVVSQPKSVALASISRFRTIYVPMLLLAILIVSFIAAKQIRKKLVPLVILQDATQRIANGDFGGHINITSDDEFAILGDAFNVMADRLGAQFTSLSTMAEIDRLILSSFDARFIISTVLGRAGELTPCTMAAVLELDDDGLGSGKLSIRCNAPDAAIEERRVQLSDEEISQLHSNPIHLLFSGGEDRPSYVTILSQFRAQTVLLFPTFIKQRLSTVIAFGYSELPMKEGHDWGSLRKFADHVAVALSNAGWEERLYHQAHYDTLTNLPNRALLKDRLEQAIARAQRNQSGVGVLFLDLDRFKLVNDSLGHAAGDIFLKKIAVTLTNSVRGVDTVVRFGGDEFVVIIPDIDGTRDAVFELGAIADKILSTTQTELEIDNQTVHPKMSIGIAMYPKDGHVPEELIKNADAAMYHAKENGRARYEFFAPELNAIASLRLKMEQELRLALANDEFLLYYQPKVDCNSGKLMGAEALIRWRHPERGMIPPPEFIGIAEESGLIQDIGAWVIRSACLQIAAWRNAGLAAVPIAVNVAARQFAESSFNATIAGILAHTQVEPGMLDLEITETTVMVDSEESIGKLRAFRDMGLRLSMDDFGTGYSSLSYLRRLPIHALKIDRSFVMALSDEHDSHAIVSATIILAHKLGLEVVAEGVETEAQRQLLQSMHCDELQGYLISEALPAEQFARDFLREDSAARSANPHLRNQRLSSTR